VTDIFEKARDMVWLAERCRLHREIARRNHDLAPQAAAAEQAMAEYETGNDAAMRILAGEDPDKVIREAYAAGLPNAPAIEHFGRILAGKDPC
jgi:hypothetical protein